MILNSTASASASGLLPHTVRPSKGKYSRKPPAEARLHARAERHQVRCHADVRRADLLVFDEPVRVELIRVRAPDALQPVVGPDRDDKVRALGNGDLAHDLSVRVRDRVREREHVVARRNAAEHVHNRVQAEDLLHRGETVRHRVEVRNGEVGVAALRGSRADRADLVAHLLLVLRVPRELVEEPGHGRCRGFVAREEEGRHLRHHLFVREAGLGIFRGVRLDCSRFGASVQYG